MHRSEPVLRASGSAGERHTLSLPCYDGASTCQLRRRRDELESDDVRVAAAGAAGLRPPASKYDLTERRCDNTMQCNATEYDTIEKLITRHM